MKCEFGLKGHDRDAGEAFIKGKESAFDEDTVYIENPRHLPIGSISASRKAFTSFLMFFGQVS